MADYKGGGLTTVHIREAAKLVESVRAETETLKKKVLEVRKPVYYLLIVAKFKNHNSESCYTI